MDLFGSRKVQKNIIGTFWDSESANKKKFKLSEPRMIQNKLSDTLSRKIISKYIIHAIFAIKSERKQTIRIFYKKTIEINKLAR